MTLGLLLINIKVEYHVSDYTMEDINEGMTNLYKQKLLQEITDKGEVVPTDEMVEIYRNYYGDLSTQIKSIQKEYSHKKSSNKDIQKELDKEEQEKINRIVENFTDNDQVKQKIKTESQRYLEKSGPKELAKVSDQVEKFSKNYQYAFSDDKGHFYTNIPGATASMSKQEMKKAMTPVKGITVETTNSMLYPETYPSSNYLMTVMLAGRDTVSMTGVYLPQKGSDLVTSILKLENKNKKIATYHKIGIILLSFTIIIWLILVYFKRLSPSIPWFKLPIDSVIIFYIIGSLIYLLNLPYQSFQIFERKLVLHIIPLVIGSWILISAITSVIRVIQIKKSSKMFKQLWHQTLMFRLNKWNEMKFNQSSLVSQFIIVMLNIILAGYTAYTLTHGVYDWIIHPLFTLLSMIWLIYFLVFMLRYASEYNKLRQKQIDFLKKIDEAETTSHGFKDNLTNFEKIETIVNHAKLSEQNSNSLKSELLTNIGHDLRTPLTSIISYSDLLAKTNLTTVEQNDYVDIISRKANHMKYLVDDLFTITKIEHGEISLVKEDIAVDQLLQQIISEQTDEFKQRDLAILYRKPEESVVASVDGGKMWRVFDNLLGNALKYSLAHTRVYVRVMEGDDDILIEVKNIANYHLNEDADRLIDKFQRADESRHTEGSGLGLAIVQSIIEAHGGSLKVSVDGDMFKVKVSLKKSL